MPLFEMDCGESACCSSCFRWGSPGLVGTCFGGCFGTHSSTGKHYGGTAKHYGGSAGQFTAQPQKCCSIASRCWERRLTAARGVVQGAAWIRRATANGNGTCRCSRSPSCCPASSWTSHLPTSRADPAYNDQKQIDRFSDPLLAVLVQRQLRHCSSWCCCHPARCSAWDVDLSSSVGGSGIICAPVVSGVKLTAKERQIGELLGWALNAHFPAIASTADAIVSPPGFWVSSHVAQLMHKANCCSK